jgi:NAD(P)-dependent dehydrogenase (short-subunit alcohol dehydrogenase family)
MYVAPDLRGRVALVAGGTRGAGRGIAVELGAAGATVYVSGRTTEAEPSPMQRPETIEETARRVTAAGGRGAAVQTDHSDPEAIDRLVSRIAEDEGGLDILVNDVWGGDCMTDWERPFWEQDVDQGLALLRHAIDTHIRTSIAVAPLMLGSEHGLIVEITDGVSARYRGTIFYDLAKSTVIRLAVAQGEDLRTYGVAVVAVSPGFLRSETMLEGFAVTEATWRDAVAQDEHFAFSETPHYIGRAIAGLAADPDRMELTTTATATWELVDRYSFVDLDGSQPKWGPHMFETLGLLA